MSTRRLPNGADHDRWECAAVYLDRCLDGKRVVDVVQLKGVSHYVFDDGHKLPLLCFCRREPLDPFDPKWMRAHILGRRLEEMSLAMVSMEDGRALEQLRLEFSKKGYSRKGYTHRYPIWQRLDCIIHPLVRMRQDQEKARARLSPGLSSPRSGK